MSKNDVNSIEEAINILNNAIKCNEKQFEKIGTHILLQDNEQEAIKIVLGNLEALCDMQKSADRELQRQKQINEEHKKENGLLREKVKELEIDLTTVYLKGVEDGKDKYEQKIKNKIEELRQDINNSKTRYPYILEHKIDILNELLQESEDK